MENKVVAGKHKHRKRWRIAGIVLLVLLVAAFFVIGNVFYNFALNPAEKKDKVFDHHEGKNAVSPNPAKEESEAWFEENDKQIKRKSVTGAELVAHEFFQDAESDWIVVVHGFTSSSFLMAAEIMKFHEMGYNVLSPDLLGCGESGGDFISMGGYDSKDLAMWCRYISEQYLDTKIAIYGVSMGATAVVNSLDENLPQNVKLFIADSAYLSLLDEFKYELNEIFGLPSFPFIQAANVVTKIRAGFWFEDVDATEALKNTKLPALIMQGSIDDFVPPYNARRIYDLIDSPKQIEIFEGRKHIKARYFDKEKYFEIIGEFLEEYMK